MTIALRVISIRSMKIVNDERSKVGPLLKRYRLSREWTYEQLAAAAGMSAGAIWYIEKGRKIPSELTVERLRKRLPGLFDQEAA